MRETIPDVIIFSGAASVEQSSIKSSSMGQGLSAISVSMSTTRLASDSQSLKTGVTITRRGKQSDAPNLCAASLDMKYVHQISGRSKYKKCNWNYNS
jgi:hypothetical protein